MRFHDPRPPAVDGAEPYRLRLEPDGAPITIGLLSNGFADAGDFLASVGDALAELLPDLSVRTVTKTSAPAPAHRRSDE